VQDAHDLRVIQVRLRGIIHGQILVERGPVSRIVAGGRLQGALADLRQPVIQLDAQHSRLGHRRGQRRRIDGWAAGLHQRLERDQGTARLHARMAGLARFQAGDRVLHG